MSIVRLKTIHYFLTIKKLIHSFLPICKDSPDYDIILTIGCWISNITIFFEDDKLQFMIDNTDYNPNPDQNDYSYDELKKSIEYLIVLVFKE